jgi:hypothetical protein
LSTLSPTNYNLCNFISKEKRKKKKEKRKKKKENEEIKSNPTKPKSRFPVEKVCKISRQVHEFT